MGCWNSRLLDEEVVSRFKARRRYMKQAVKSRRSFSAAHSLYLRSLRSTGSALLQFANVETRHYPHQPSPPTLYPTTPHASEISSSSDTWGSSAPSPLPPPPPPPPSSSSKWDFWYPYGAAAAAKGSSVSRTATEEEFEDAVSEVAAPPPSVIIENYSKRSGPPSGGELAVVVAHRGRRDMSEIAKDLDDCFLAAADAGKLVSFLLEVPNATILRSNPGGRAFSPSRWSRYGRPMEDQRVSNLCHSSTLEKIYAWEKKLYLEIKSLEKMKMAKEKKGVAMRKMEAKGAEYVKVEKKRREIERLESKLAVAAQAIETTMIEITTLIDAELLPQLIQLLDGLACMWRSMFDCHQEQTRIVQLLQHLAAAPAIPAPVVRTTSDVHRHAALQLEHEVDRWHSSFCYLIKYQRDYVSSLAGYLRISSHNARGSSRRRYDGGTQDNELGASLCDTWQLAIERLPDRVASDGIKSFLTVVHAIVVQQAEEKKQKKASHSAFKELEKRAAELRRLEMKYSPSMTAMVEKRVRVERLKEKAEEDRRRHEKAARVTRAMTANNLSTGLLHVVQAVAGFAGVIARAFRDLMDEQVDGGGAAAAAAEMKMLQLD